MVKDYWQNAIFFKSSIYFFKQKGMILYEFSKMKMRRKIYSAINTVKKSFGPKQKRWISFSANSANLLMRASWESLQGSWLPQPNHCKYWHFIWQKVFKIKIMAMIPYANMCVPNKLIFNLLNANFTAVALISKLKWRRRKSHKQLQLFFLNLFWCFYNVFR